MVLKLNKLKKMFVLKFFKIVSAYSDLHSQLHMRNEFFDAEFENSNLNRVVVLSPTNSDENNFEPNSSSQVF